METKKIKTRYSVKFEISPEGYMFLKLVRKTHQTDSVMTSLKSATSCTRFRGVPNPTARLKVSRLDTIVV